MRFLGILFGSVFSLFTHDVINAQVKCDPKLLYDNVFYTVCIMPVDPISLKGISLVQNKVGLSHSDFIGEYITNNDSVLFATNACIGDGTGAPLGLFISEGQEVSGINLNEGKGNFFLKPNGVLLVSDSTILIIESSKAKITSSTRVGVQSGPMLLVDDQIHSAFDANSKNKNIRSGVGVYSEKGKQYLAFCKSNEPVSFYQFASLFKNRFKCSNALCLESAGSAMYSPTLGIISPESGNSIGNYIAIKKKEPNGSTRKIIQMTKSPGGTYEVPVELNGVLKISFIFDSGASDVSISSDVALTLIKTGTIKESDFIGTQQYTFANGSSATSQVFMLQEIKIGGYVIKKVRASISNSISAPMLLGQSVLQRLGKFTIDNNKHTLTIE